jgi:hypothetical protein
MQQVKDIEAMITNSRTIIKEEKRKIKLGMKALRQLKRFESVVEGGNSNANSKRNTVRRRNKVSRRRKLHTSGKDQTGG